MARRQNPTDLVDTAGYYLCISLALGLMVVGYFGPEEYLGALGSRLISLLIQ